MKKMEVAKKKNSSSEKDSLPTDKNNKNIHILSDSMMKHVKGWEKIWITKFSMLEQMSLTLSYYLRE